MKKTLLVQSPAHLYEVFPIFYKQIAAQNYFDKIYVVTDYPKPSGLGSDVELIQLKRDLGRANNFMEALKHMDEDVFVMMCDDHVIRQDKFNLDPYFDIMVAEPSIGRLQLSPPSSNYYQYLRHTTGSFFVPDDSQPWYPYERGYRFYMNFQPSVWRREFFEYCISGGENRNKLELRAGKRARANSKFVSGFIPHHAVRYENFLASCKVHSADPNFDKDKSVAHYREEFIHYALKHNTNLDPTKRVFVKRLQFRASVPLGFYIEHRDDDAALAQYYTKDTSLKGRLTQIAKRAKRKYVPHW